MLLKVALSVGLVATVSANAVYPEFADTRLNDFANVVRPEHAVAIRTELNRLRDDIGIEAVVITINSIHDYGTDDATIESFATYLFNKWGVGNAERNDGAMLLVAVKDRKVRIEVGSGFGDKLNAPTKRIIDSQIIPNFKRGDYSTGILEGARALGEELKKWKPAAEADDTTVSGAPAASDTAAPISRAVPEAIAAPTLPPVPMQTPAPPVSFRPPAPIRPAYQDAPNQFKRIQNGLIVVMFGGIGLAFVGLLFTRSNRCPKCKTQMQLLDPRRDHERLNQGQVMEETLNTVDYQFYRCAQCGHEDMRRKQRFFSGYSQCPGCSYRTLKQDQRVINYPTRHSVGAKLIIQDCQNCHYHNEDTIIMPKLPDDSDPHGSGFRSFGSRSSSSHSHGSSGNSSSGSRGGGFGGGRSSGGGSSGSW